MRLKDDLMQLENVTEAEIVSALCERFTEGSHQTWLGDSCTISINPMLEDKVNIMMIHN